jgi:hypothetical protein
MLKMAESVPNDPSLVHVTIKSPSPSTPREALGWLLVV